MAMTTSVTRSRRAEVHPSHPNSQRPGLLATAKAHNTKAFAINQQRNKRQIDPSGRDFDPISHKKARIAVEIPSRSAFRAKNAKAATDALSLSLSLSSKPQATKPAADADPNPPKPPPRAPSCPATTVAPADTPAPPTATVQPALTKHQEKVANGLKHELNRLQANAAVEMKEQGRKLRSQEATRFKSDLLSAFFPDYDEVIGNDPKEHHILNLETPIVIVGPPAAHPLPPNTKGSHHPHDPYPVRSFGDSLFTDLCDSQIIDFSFLQSKKSKSQEDPLPDSVYTHTHTKEKRREQTIRNTEKGRAQFEKDQIIRLLDDLQGPDWLRVMGVSGITESKKKKFEPARAHFIKGCQAILEKFRRWVAEEKRRKQAKELAIAQREAAARLQAESEEASREESSVVEEESEESEEKEIPDSDDEMEEDEPQEDDQDEDPPDNSDSENDVDASVAKQLQEEATAAAKKKPAPPASRRTRWKAPPPPPPPPHSQPREREPPPRKDFTSFFEKKYQRDAAVNKTRRKGRTVMAWGLPLPDVNESPFELPEDFADEEFMRMRERRKRRDKRARH
ncbi:something about silencing, SAS, complex subunit 4-domain-containing protein [Podospora didyma]|uniref:Something about silencing, SAS, complex subunit 4-domain-containing protein n=1 Tax=Podospora didyma TaxID=330526 RepID=A0AAE0P786_9PEZI|nr:something about silencing, SAS, complex subunit 4-domain-containing protein [Podospora didyma]